MVLHRRRLAKTQDRGPVPLHRTAARVPRISATAARLDGRSVAREAGIGLEDVELPIGAPFALRVAAHRAELDQIGGTFGIVAFHGTAPESRDRSRLREA